MEQSETKTYHFKHDNLTLEQWEILRNFIKTNTKFIETSDYDDGYLWAKYLTKKEIIIAKEKFQDNIIKMIGNVKVISKCFVPYSYYYFYTDKKHNEGYFVFRIKYTEKVHEDLIRVMYPFDTLLASDCAEFWYFYQAPVFFNQTVPILWKCIADLVINLQNDVYRKFVYYEFNLIECHSNYGLKVLSRKNTFR